MRWGHTNLHQGSWMVVWTMYFIWGGGLLVAYIWLDLAEPITCIRDHNQEQERAQNGSLWDTT